MIACPHGLSRDFLISALRIDGLVGCVCVCCGLVGVVVAQQQNYANAQRADDDEFNQMAHGL